MLPLDTFRSLLTRFTKRIITGVRDVQNAKLLFLLGADAGYISREQLQPGCQVT